MRAEAWIAWRLLFSRRSLFGGSAPLALFGLILGVASLVAAMAVVSGFERTLRDSMSDVTGHVAVVQRGPILESPDEMSARLRAIEPEITAATPFLRLEALLVAKGRLQGVLIQGTDGATRDQVLDLRSRLIAGSLDLEPREGRPAVLIGKGIASQYGLSPGDSVKMVVPVSDSYDPERFSRRLGDFVIAGVVDLGKFEWNERFLLADLKPLQELGGVGERFNGLLLRFPDPDLARLGGQRLGRALGPTSSVADWYELNGNLFEAVRLERVVIFFVIYIIVIVAAFNIASTLFVNVIRRTDEIALLKALGFTRGAVLRVFSAQGFFFGLIGFIGGALLGLALAEGFTSLQSHYQLMAGSVYKVEGVRASVRMIDLAAIAAATLGICVLAALAPAWRGSRLSPVEGLRNE